MDKVFSPGMPGMWIIGIFLQKIQFKFYFFEASLLTACLSSLSSGLQTYIPNCPSSESTSALSGSPTSSLPPTCPITPPPPRPPSLGRKTPLSGYTSQHLGGNLDASLSCICSSQCIPKSSWFSSPEPVLLPLNYQLHLGPEVLQELPDTPHPGCPLCSLLYSAGIPVIF